MPADLQQGVLSAWSTMLSSLEQAYADVADRPFRQARTFTHTTSTHW